MKKRKSRRRGRVGEEEAKVRVERMNSQKSVVKQSRVSQLKGQTEIKRRWKKKE